LAVLLDTDHLSILQQREQPAADILESRLSTMPASEIKVSIISFQEQAQGWLAYLRRARKSAEILKGFAELQRLVHDFPPGKVMPFDGPALDEFLRLQQQRIRIGTNDLRIAAIARANRVKLLSRNLRDFRQVPHLDVEDWTA
jgi:tRNA(fMet)-specific endonuclease VapC